MQMIVYSSDGHRPGHPARDHAGRAQAGGVRCGQVPGQAGPDAGPGAGPGAGAGAGPGFAQARAGAGPGTGPARALFKSRSAIALSPVSATAFIVGWPPPRIAIKTLLQSESTSAVQVLSLTLVEPPAVMVH